MPEASGSLPDLAAGDCAESHHLVSGKPTWVALGTVANKHGRVAGIDISGGNAGFPGVVGIAITKFYELAQLVDLDLAYAPPFSPVWDPCRPQRACCLASSVASSRAPAEPRDCPPVACVRPFAGQCL
jgi:hypothetical protein